MEATLHGVTTKKTMIGIIFEKGNLATNFTEMYSCRIVKNI
jgi:hypothetical protein